MLIWILKLFLHHTDVIHVLINIQDILLNLVCFITVILFLWFIVLRFMFIRIFKIAIKFSNVIHVFSNIWHIQLNFIISLSFSSSIFRQIIITRFMLIRILKFFSQSSYRKDVMVHILHILLELIIDCILIASVPWVATLTLLIVCSCMITRVFNFSSHSLDIINVVIHILHIFL